MDECFQCGECCRTLKEVLITPEEYDILLKHNNPDVIKKGDRFLMSLPCVFLRDNKCSVWNERPCMCRMWHCGKLKPSDKILEWRSEILELMERIPEYKEMKIKMEEDAVKWGNDHGWNWSRK